MFLSTWHCISQSDKYQFKRIEWDTMGHSVYVHNMIMICLLILWFSPIFCCEKAHYYDSLNVNNKKILESDTSDEIYISQKPKVEKFFRLLLENRDLQDVEQETFEHIIECNYKTEALCGDVCMPRGWTCECGNERFDVVYDWKQCCLPPVHISSKTKTCYKHVDTFTIHCGQGKPMHIRELCNGKCYNEYKYRNLTKLGLNSLYQCDTKDQCVEVAFMCQGYSLCQDKSDIKACQDLQCPFLTQLDEPSKYKLSSELARGHSYCGYPSEMKDGVYDSIGREDETTLKLVTNEIKVDFSKLEQCEKNFNGGFKCNNIRKECSLKEDPLCIEDDCRGYHMWCRPGSGYTCSTNEGVLFSTEDKNLCGNATFWSDKPCLLHNHLGTLIGQGSRCTSSYQHCYFPWYQMDQLHYQESIYSQLLIMFLFDNYNFRITRIRFTLQPIVWTTQIKYSLLVLNVSFLHSLILKPTENYPVTEIIQLQSRLTPN